MLAQVIRTFYESLVEEEARVVAVRVNDVDASIRHFAELCMRSGRSVYLWTESRGLISLKASEISVPGTRGLEEALRYVRNSLHYGVYVFAASRLRLTQEAASYLNDLRGDRAGSDRKAIFLSEYFHLSLATQELFVHTQEPTAIGERPRLRDGRWVLGES